MRSSLRLLVCCGLACLCLCPRLPAAPDYDPAQTPLTADELAQLLGVEHWKITSLPRSDTPYWGVQVVARNADGAVVGRSGAQQFGTSLTADGNSQILVGIRREATGFGGTLMLGSRPRAVAATRFTFSHSHDEDRGSESSVGLTWHDDRAELVRCTGANQQTTFSIAVELLRAPPK